MSFERAGTPAVGVMTDAFVDGAERMARACGAENYGFAVIAHPISSADDDELLGRAEAILEQADELVRTGAVRADRKPASSPSAGGR